MGGERRGCWLRVAVWVGVAIVGALSPSGAVAQEGGPSDDEAAVLAVVRQLFDGMRDKNEDLLRSVWHPEARLQSAGRDASGTPQLRSTPIEGFISSVLSSGAHLDEVTFDEIVRITGDLATVWAPYNLFVDGDFQHCGVDAIQMVREGDGWRIHQLTDTRTREGCDPSRRGDAG